MKICFVCNGVITRHSTMKRAFGLGDALAKLGHDVSILLEDDLDNHQRLDLTAGVRGLWYKASSRFWTARNRKIAALRGQQFDVVHICGLGWRNAIPPGSMNATRVLMDHVEIESCLAEASVVRRLAQRWLEAWSLRAYKDHMCASRYLTIVFRHQALLSHLDRNFIYSPYGSEVWAKPIKERVAAIRGRFQGRKILLYLGGLYREYGFYEMLEMAKQLEASGEMSLTLLIVGRGPEAAAGAKWIRENNLSKMVSLEGYVEEEDLANYLDAADAFICPLHDTIVDWARCPSKLLTYIAYDRPIVTAAIGEAVEYLGRSAFYYNPRDQASLNRAVLQAITCTDEWRPSYSRETHTWMLRAREYQDWLQGIA